MAGYDSRPMVAPFLPDADKVRALRDAIPGTGAGIYLNTASAGPLPAEVDAAMRALREREVRIGRGDDATAEEALARRDEARGVLAALVGAPVDEIALTHGTLDGMATAVGAVPLGPGDVLVATDEEHPAVDRLLAGLVRRHDVRVRRVAVDRDRALSEIETEFGDATAGGGARVCFVPHVTWATGRRLPVDAIAAAARAGGAWTVVDGALAAGAIPVALDATTIDFHAFPGRKWLLAPGGTGALRVGPRAMTRLEPAAPIGDRSEPAGEEGAVVSAAGARGWEVGGWDDPVCAGLARAVGWLEMYVGLDWAYARVAGLVERLVGRLGGIPRVELLAPRDELAAIVSFRVAGWRAAAVAEELRRRDFAIVATIPGYDAVRLSLGAWNTEDELDRVAETIELVASHEPGTLPRRPSLVVLPAQP